MIRTRVRTRVVTGRKNTLDTVGLRGHEGKRIRAAGLAKALPAFRPCRDGRQVQPGRSAKLEFQTNSKERFVCVCGR